MKSIGIREMVGLVLRTGDLDNRLGKLDNLDDGNEVHRLLQKQYDTGWEKEVFFKRAFPEEEIVIQGRADGVFENHVIHEIKSTSRKIKDFEGDGSEVHWAQGYCYALILAERENLESVEIRLTYYNLRTEERLDFVRVIETSDLRTSVTNIVKAYSKWNKIQKEWLKIRTKSLKELKFPFDRYRNGQRQLSTAVYKAMRDRFVMMAEAPTGVGKTISTLFPSLKAMGEDHLDKIFYLTAKTVARSVAEEALDLLRQNGGQIKSVTLTAKEKICVTGEKKCNPVDCTRAKGHFDRINDCLMALLTDEVMYIKGTIENYAEKHQVCPFELSFDLASFSDVVICDYNYVFDPLVKIQRFFGEVTEQYGFLIDEGHNLPSRARDMFSLSLHKEGANLLKKSFPKKSAPYKEMGKLSRILGEIPKSDEIIEFGYKTTTTLNDKFCTQVRRCFDSIVKYLGETEGVELGKEETDLFFSLYRFDHLISLFSSGHLYLESRDHGGSSGIICIDPSELLKSTYQNAVGTVVFSATLAPYPYYQDVLGLDEAKKIFLGSPFPHENRLILLGAGIDTRLKNRTKHYDGIATYICNVTNAKAANYLAFFPSYEFMKSVASELHVSGEVLAQWPNMTDDEKRTFLSWFDTNEGDSKLGLAVLGGSFSEGIDLVGDKLEGVIVVGFGTPMVNRENEIMRQFYDGKSKDGYTYAYVYPSINKVVQAVGRLIRTEKDRGLILLLDDRYLSSHYRKLFPVDWQVKKCSRFEEVTSACQLFWENV